MMRLAISGTGFGELLEARLHVGHEPDQGVMSGQPACLDALVAKRSTPVERIAEGKVLLVRMASILTKLMERFETKDPQRDATMKGTQS